MTWIGRLALALVATGCLSVGGCYRNPYPGANPYGATWPAPAAAPAAGLPPTLPPATSGQPSTAPLPSVPQLPPPGSSSRVLPNLQRPQLGAPGTIQQQRQQADRFDPYADNDAAPAIEGGRPREFDKPRAEPVRARGFRDTRWPL